MENIESLAATHWSEGRWIKALKPYKLALDGRKRLLGPRHFESQDAMFAERRQLCSRLLFDHGVTLFGSDDPTTTESIFYLAQLYKA